MSSKDKQTLENGLIVLGTLLIITFAFAGQWFFLLTIPLLMLVGVLVFYQPDWLFFGLGFLTPLSINPHDAEWGKLSLALPTEPIAALLLVLFIYLAITSDKIDHRLLKHPVSVLIYFYFIWLLVTTATSVDKIVSIKFVIAKLWFIVPGYFLAATYFKEPRNTYRYLMLFVAGMVIISLFNIGHLSMYGFEDKPSQSTMQPFFKDHTILGAVSAMVLPLCFGLFRLSQTDVVKRAFFFSAIFILLFGTIVTYSRAAWASIIPALLLLLVFVLHIRFRWVFVTMMIVMTYLFSNMDSILMELERNKISGSDDIEENIESISNISSDPSNLERINRWASAIEMFKEKPVFGFGPGTYMFEYAPYQLGRNYTSISTNFGDVGNAHSEYLGPLAESGLMGLLIFFSFFVMAMYYSMRAFHHQKDPGHRIMICTIACALITYFAHGFLNNFLDTDKACFIFWPLIAAIVVYDLQSEAPVKSNLEGEQLSR